MRSCTIVKALVLSLGAITVIARSLPAQRSEINARAAGGDGFSNNATKRDGTDGEHFDISRPSHSYLSFPKGRLEANAALSKRDRDYRGVVCAAYCKDVKKWSGRDPDDCNALHDELLELSGEIDVAPGT